MLVALAVSVGVLVLPSGASAQLELPEFQSAVDAMQAVDPTLDPPPNEPRRDFVVGGANNGLGASFGVSAHSDADGQDPFGHLSATEAHPTLPGFTVQIRFRVTCLAVLGNMAAVGGVQTQASSNDHPPGTNYIVVFRDSGMPGGVGDGASFNAGFGPVEKLCSGFIGLAAGAGPIAHGNILVHDAMP